MSEDILVTFVDMNMNIVDTIEKAYWVIEVNGETGIETWYIPPHRVEELT